MSKIKDDWMNPEKTDGIYSMQNYKPKPFIIQRLKAPPICSWLGSPPKPSWETWKEFDTEDERNAELENLRNTTEWRLRPASQLTLGNNVIGIQVEDEEAELLARLEILRHKKQKK